MQGRNELCQCGSGRKFKKCCLKKMEENTVGRIGEVDLIQNVEDGRDYTITKSGAKVYHDASKHEILPIAEISSPYEKGTVYEVLSTGVSHKFGQIPMVVVKQDDAPIAYRLPEGLKDWAESAVGLSMSGMNMFPCEVEFSRLKNGRYCADYVS